MVIDVKWKRINGILDLKYLRKFTVHKFIGVFFFGEMIFVDLKSFVSIISNSKLYH